MKSPHSIPHVDKALDLFKTLGVITDWGYDKATDTYTVRGNLGTPGIEHKVYSAKGLSNLSVAEIDARIILDFTAEGKGEQGKGLFYRIKHKLKTLCIAIYRQKDKQAEADSYEVSDIMQKLIKDGTISRDDMLRCNDFWKKYK